MLLRAWTLRVSVNTWLRREAEPRLDVLKVQSAEWTLVKYLIMLLRPFHRWTKILSVTKGTTIHRGWFVYNLIAAHLLNLSAYLDQKEFLWRDQIVKAVDKGLSKLLAYRGKATQNEALIYTLAAVLDPSTRLTQFSVKPKGNALG